MKTRNSQEYIDRATAVARAKAAQAREDNQGLANMRPWQYGAWRFLISFQFDEKSRRRICVFSAQLTAPKLGSELKDWELLGVITSATGAEPKDLIGDTIGRDPEGVHKFLWFEDEAGGHIPLDNEKLRDEVERFDGVIRRPGGQA